MSGKSASAAARDEPGGERAAANRDTRPTSALDTARTIAWSFFGVRRRNDHERESNRINPIHVVVAGFAGILLLVAGLIVLVNWVVA